MVVSNVKVNCDLFWATFQKQRRHHKVLDQIECLCSGLPHRNSKV